MLASHCRQMHRKYPGIVLRREAPVKTGSDEVGHRRRAGPQRRSTAQPHHSTHHTAHGLQVDPAVRISIDRHARVLVGLLRGVVEVVIHGDCLNVEWQWHCPRSSRLGVRSVLGSTTGHQQYGSLGNEEVLRKWNATIQQSADS